MTKILLISEDYIKENSNLPDNIWGKNLMPSIREAQDIYLQVILGGSLYKSILNKVNDGSITASTNTAYKTLLDDYIQPYLLYQTIYCLIPIISSKLSNLGTVVSNDEHLTNLSQDERDDLANHYVNIADNYAKAMQNHILKNCNDFQELSQVDFENMKASLNSAASTALWLGGYRGRRI